MGDRRGNLPAACTELHRNRCIPPMTSSPAGCGRSSRLLLVPDLIGQLHLQRSPSARTTTHPSPRTDTMVAQRLGPRRARTHLTARPLSEEEEMRCRAAIRRTCRRADDVSGAAGRAGTGGRSCSAYGMDGRGVASPAGRWHLLHHDVQLEQIRGDRILREALAANADPLHVMTVVQSQHAVGHRLHRDRPQHDGTPDRVLSAETMSVTAPN